MDPMGGLRFDFGMGFLGEERLIERGGEFARNAPSE
jgi:hypothetical protein